MVKVSAILPFFFKLKGFILLGFSDCTQYSYIVTLEIICNKKPLLLQSGVQYFSHKSLFEA
jgi:hypothetical protein